LTRWALALTYRAGQSLEYVDSPAVRAAKDGNVLILDGIERVSDTGYV
jgi:hypothetical protein